MEETIVTENEDITVTVMVTRRGSMLIRMYDEWHAENVEAYISPDQARKIAKALLEAAGEE